MNRIAKPCAVESRRLSSRSVAPWPVASTRTVLAASLALALVIGCGSAFAGGATPPPAPLPEPASTTATAATAPTPAAANDGAATTGPAGLLRAQVLLDRAHFSPGEIDGQVGSNMRRALVGYQKAHDLTADGELGSATWAALNADTSAPVVAYTLTADDVAGPFAALPKDVVEQSKLKSLGYASIEESLGERFHASPALLKQLNPGVDFSKAGTAIQVPSVVDGVAAIAGVAKLVVDKSDSTVSLVDGAGKTLALFPASTGSEHDPLPIGNWKILGVVKEPTYSYNPKLFWDADKSHSKAQLAAGPNNPVGAVWIDLSKEHYGIHGTPEPSRVGKGQSHGCVRLTNWDARIVAGVVNQSIPVVMQE